MSDNGQDLFQNLRRLIFDPVAESIRTYRFAPVQIAEHTNTSSSNIQRVLNSELDTLATMSASIISCFGYVLTLVPADLLGEATSFDPRPFDHHSRFVFRSNESRHAIETLVAALARVRTRSHIDAGAISQELGMAQQYVANIEKVHNIPKLSSLQRYADVLGLSIVAVPKDSPFAGSARVPETVGLKEFVLPKPFMRGNAKPLAGLDDEGRAEQERLVEKAAAEPGYTRSYVPGQDRRPRPLPKADRPQSQAQVAPVPDRPPPDKSTAPPEPVPAAPDVYRRFFAVAHRIGMFGLYRTLTAAKTGDGPLTVGATFQGIWDAGGAVLFSSHVFGPDLDRETVLHRFCLILDYEKRTSHYLTEPENARLFDILRPDFWNAPLEAAVVLLQKLGQSLHPVQLATGSATHADGGRSYRLVSAMRSKVMADAALRNAMVEAFGLAEVRDLIYGRSSPNARLCIRMLRLAGYDLGIEPLEGVPAAGYGKRPRGESLEDAAHAIAHCIATYRDAAGLGFGDVSAAVGKGEAWCERFETGDVNYTLDNAADYAAQVGLRLVLAGADEQLRTPLPVDGFVVPGRERRSVG